MSDDIPKTASEFEAYRLRQEVQGLREHVDRSILGIERSMDSFQKVTSQDRDEKHKQVLELIKGVRDEVDKSISAFASRAKEIDSNIVKLQTDTAVIQSERTDFKAVWTFVRNTVIGTVLGAIMLFFLKPH